MKPLFEPKYVERTVDGKDLRFYAISIVTTFKLKKMGTEIAKAIAVFTEDTSRDTHQTEQKFAQTSGPSGTVLEDKGITPELAEFRSHQRANAIEGLVQAFSSTENMSLLAEIVMSSLRDEFPKGKQDTMSPKEFLESTPMGIWPDLALGVIEANKGVLGPLSKALERLKTNQSPSESQPSSPESSSAAESPES